MPEKPKRDALWHQHAFLVVMLGGIGVMVLLPGDTFITGQGWRVIASTLTEEQFGTICVLVALFGAIGLFTERPRIRFITALVLATAHFILAATFAFSNPSGIAGLLLIGVAYQGYYLIYRRRLA